MNTKCPIKPGLRPGKSWLAKFFASDIEEVGESSCEIDYAWYAPVRYQDGSYGIVKYVPGKLRAGHAEDEVTNVRANTMYARAILFGADSMPQILPGASVGVLEISVEQSDDRPTVGAMATGKTVYVIQLFGVCGKRLGRKDKVDLFKVSVPNDVVHKWT